MGGQCIWIIVTLSLDYRLIYEHDTETLRIYHVMSRLIKINETITMVDKPLFDFQFYQC